MPSIDEMMEDLFKREGIASLDFEMAKLKMLVDEGVITQDEATQRITDFKRRKGMAHGGDVKKGIGSFLPRMSNGGEALDFPRLFRALIQVESGGIPDRVSPAGAIGLTQIMPETAMEPGYGVDNIFTLARKMSVPFEEESLSEAKRLLFNTELNTQFGSDYLKAMINYSGGDIKTALQGYNYGLDRVLDLKARGEPITVDETIQYPIKVMAAYNGINPNDPEQMAVFTQSPNIESAMFELGQAEGAVEPSRDVLEPKTAIQQVLTDLNIFKSDDQIRPTFSQAPETRPTELVDKLGLPGDIMREADVDMAMAMDPSLFGKSQIPPSRPEEMEENDATLASSLLPPQRPFGIN